jgi:hypothetical protein
MCTVVRTAQHRWPGSEDIGDVLDQPDERGDTYDRKDRSSDPRRDGRAPRRGRDGERPCGRPRRESDNDGPEVDGPRWRAYAAWDSCDGSIRVAHRRGACPATLHPSPSRVRVRGPATVLLVEEHAEPAGDHLLASVRKVLLPAGLQVVHEFRDSRVVAHDDEHRRGTPLGGVQSPPLLEGTPLQVNALFGRFVRGVLSELPEHRVCGLS